MPRQLVELLQLSVEEVCADFDAMLRHDWRRLGISAEEVREFCVWRNARAELAGRPGSSGCWSAPKNFLAWAPAAPRPGWPAYVGPSVEELVLQQQRPRFAFSSFKKISCQLSDPVPRLSLSPQYCAGLLMATLGLSPTAMSWRRASRRALLHVQGREAGVGEAGGARALPGRGEADPAAHPRVEAL